MERIERGRGRFRNFLKVTLDHFLTDQERARKALARGGGVRTFSIDASEDSMPLVAPGDPKPVDFDELYSVRPQVEGFVGDAIQVSDPQASKARSLTKRSYSSMPAGGSSVPVRQAASGAVSFSLPEGRVSRRGCRIFDSRQEEESGRANPGESSYNFVTGCLCGEGAGTLPKAQLVAEGSIWAATVLQEALAILRDRYARDRQENTYRAFEVYCLSNEKINRKGFVARRTLDEGIEQLLRLYRMLPRGEYRNA